MQRLLAVGLAATVAVLVGMTVGSRSDAADALPVAVAACPARSDAAVVGGKRVCLKVGLPCQVKYQALYRGRGYVCGASKKLGLLVCTGGTVYAVIGGVHGCIKRGQNCVAKFQAQYAKFGLDCDNGRLVKPNPQVKVSGPEEVVYDDAQACPGAAFDEADGGVRAFRDASGQVQMVMPSIGSNRRMIGPDLDHLSHDCTVTLDSNQNPDPSA